MEKMGFPKCLVPEAENGINHPETALYRDQNSAKRVSEFLQTGILRS
jgi:molybdopterin-guanine dinucleotide biosynthesis protein A